MTIDYRDESLSQRYHLMAQTVIPRPIAWIVTESKEGVVNIAPFSYFTALSSEPPTLIVSIGHKPDGTPKDTLRNLRETKRCTLCLVDEAHLQPMHFSSKPLDATTSEADYFQIPTQKIEADFPPIVQGIPSAFFCTLYQEVDLEGSKTIPVILKIEKQYIDDGCVTRHDDKLTITFKPIARIGKSYAFLGEEVPPPAIP